MNSDENIEDSKTGSSENKTSCLYKCREEVR